MSTHTRTSFGFFGFGAATIWFTHGVGPVASSMISFSSSRLSFSATLLLRWKGILLSACVTGGTLGSTWSFISTSRIFPTHWKSVVIVLLKYGFWERLWLSDISVRLVWGQDGIFPLCLCRIAFSVDGPNVKSNAIEFLCRVVAEKGAMVILIT